MNDKIERANLKLQIKKNIKQVQSEHANSSKRRNSINKMQMFQPKHVNEEQSFEENFSSSYQPPEPPRIGHPLPVIVQEKEKEKKYDTPLHIIEPKKEMKSSNQQRKSEIKILSVESNCNRRSTALLSSSENMYGSPTTTFTPQSP